MRKNKWYDTNDHPSSGDLEHQKFLFESPQRPGWLWSSDLCSDGSFSPSSAISLRDYIDWLEWRVDDLAAHNRINADSQNYLHAKCEALENQLKKMTKRRPEDGMGR